MLKEFTLNIIRSVREECTVVVEAPSLEAAVRAAERDFEGDELAGSLERIVVSVEVVP